MSTCLHEQVSLPVFEGSREARRAGLGGETIETRRALIGSAPPYAERWRHALHRINVVRRTGRGKTGPKW